MTERQKFNAEEKKVEILSAYNYSCVRCSRPALFLAHLIPQTKGNIKKYGNRIIHHEKNMRPVCACLRCNDACSISNRPVEIEKLVQEIKQDLEEINDGRN